MSEPRELTIVTDGDDERLYVDGEQWGIQSDSYLFSGELVEAAEGQACILKQIHIEHSWDEWPEKLEVAIRKPGHAPLEGQKALF